MFVRLYYILVVTATLILLFFIASSIAFSSRLSPSFPARTWQTRWILLDGWLSLPVSYTHLTLPTIYSV